MIEDAKAKGTLTNFHPWVPTPCLLGPWHVLVRLVGGCGCGGGEGRGGEGKGVRGGEEMGDEVRWVQSDLNMTHVSPGAMKHAMNLFIGPITSGVGFPGD